MILVDSSAWIEFLRSTGSDIHLRLRGLLRAGDELGTTEVVLTEILAGARTDREREELRRLLYGRDGDFEVISRHAPRRLVA